MEIFKKLKLSFKIGIGFAVGILISPVIEFVPAYSVTVSITKPINRIVKDLNVSSLQVGLASGNLSSFSHLLAEMNH